MGANQSTNGGSHGGAQSNNGEVKTCYYELLGVDRQAADEEIKKAYRKKALELHPDRNYGNIEESTKLFAQVQSAYEVLSDPQERVWYDSHRSAILRGQSEDSGEHYEHNVRVTTSEDIMRMFGKFNGRMDFSDGSNGFFTILRNTFDTLAKEEEMACDWEGLEPVDYPSFGHAKDDYEVVVRPFYAIWNGFATKKTFLWKDVYRYSDAPDRRVRRLMEKENKRSRDEGIREFNETVRSLVQFVRKRDPRYIPNIQTEAERQKIIRDAATAQAARSRAANRARASQQDVIPAWTRNNDPVEEASEDEEGEEEPEEQLECVVCRKMFKSEKQFEAHERSKKHSKAVQQLQKQMRNDDQALNLDRQANDDISAITDLVDGVDLTDAQSFGNAEKDEPGKLDVSNDSGNGGSFFDVLEVAPELQDATPASKKEASPSASDASSASSEDDDYVPRDEVEKRIVGDTEHDPTGLITPQSAVEGISQKLSNGTLNDSGADSATQQKLGKAKAKRAKKAAQQSASPSAAEFKCAACNAGFPSKSRLFNHIKDFGHAQPVPKAMKSGRGKKR